MGAFYIGALEVGVNHAALFKAHISQQRARQWQAVEVDPLHEGTPEIEADPLPLGEIIPQNGPPAAIMHSQQPLDIGAGQLTVGKGIVKRRMLGAGAIEAHTVTKLPYRELWLYRLLATDHRL
jgi:hypothetical protein